MAVDALLEHRIVLSLEKFIRDNGPAGKKLLFRGERTEADRDDVEWLAFTLLSIPRDRSRGGTWQGSILFQIACFAHLAVEDGDDATAPWRLASEIRAAIEKKEIPIKSYDLPSPALITCLGLQEVAMQYIDESTSRGADDQDAHSVVCTCSGFLFAA